MSSSENLEKRKQKLLEAKPVRMVDWIEENGLVKLKVIKFRNKFAWLCRLFKKPNYFFVNLDEVGTFIWKKCNGKNSVKEILTWLEEKYGKEKMEERLMLFLEMLRRAGYIKYE